METAEKINHEKINMPFYKYFTSEPFWSILDHAKAKKLYDMFDVKQIYKIRKKLNLFQNILFKKESKLLIKLIIKEIPQYERFLFYF